MESVVSGNRLGVALTPEGFPDVLLKWCFEARGVFGYDSYEYTLIYVQGPIRSIPTPMGRVPVAQVSSAKLAEFIKIQEIETKCFEEKLLKVCDKYKVRSTFLVVESDQPIGKVLVEQIDKYQFSNFIVGSSPRCLRLRAGVSDYVLNHSPSFCSVHCVSKAARLVSCRERFAPCPSKKEKKMRNWFGSPDNVPRTSTCFQSSTDFLFPRLSEASTIFEEPEMLMYEEPRTPEIHEISSDVHEGSTSDVKLENVAEGGTNDELEILKQQLQNAKIETVRAKDEARREYVRSRQAEAHARRASEKAEEMCVQRAEEARKIEAAVMAAEIVKRKLQEECEKHAETLRAAESMQRALQEEIRKKDIETKMLIEGLERDARKGQYTEFTFEELQIMTNYFSESNKVGDGGYGSVYRGRYYHTDVAVKVLKKDGLQGPREFKMEMEVLSRLHHPHIVLLLGGCSEHGCIVYEFMENGSLEDRLCCMNNSAPIPAYTRVKIAVEIATALMFLHRARPLPVVHRDLKPANILLDSHFRIKVGDVGCARFMPSSTGSSVCTIPVGTFAYIDPEFQRVGRFSPKSDVYALGIILLRLLTALTPVGIANTVSRALERGTLMEILDETAGVWPLAAAMQLAYIGLSCAEPERKNRPELEQVLNMLVQLQSTFECERQMMSRPGVPTLFICPILQEVMEYPVIAADGYTYEHQAIRLWLEKSNASPMTNLPLENKYLIANRLIRSAICEWRTSNG